MPSRKRPRYPSNHRSKLHHHPFLSKHIQIPQNHNQKGRATNEITIKNHKQPPLSSQHPLSSVLPQRESSPPTVGSTLVATTRFPHPITTSTTMPLINRTHGQPSSLPPGTRIFPNENDDNNNNTQTGTRAADVLAYQPPPGSTGTGGDKRDSSKRSIESTTNSDATRAAVKTTTMQENNDMTKTNAVGEIGPASSDMSQSAASLAKNDDNSGWNESDDTSSHSDGGQFADADDDDDNDPGEFFRVIGTGMMDDPSRSRSNAGTSNHLHAELHDTKPTNGSRIQPQFQSKRTTTTNILVETTKGKEHPLEGPAKPPNAPAILENPAASEDGSIPMDATLDATQSVDTMSKSSTVVDNQERKTECQTLKSKENVSGNAMDNASRPLDMLRKEAKAKLRKAMLAKKRALEEQRARVASASLQQSVEYLRPINALLKGGLDSLFITGITDSDGPHEKVRFMSTPMLMEEDDEWEAPDNEGEKFTRNDESRKRPNKSLEELVTLMKRRRELQQIMIEAREKKERLEAAQKSKPTLNVDTQMDFGHHDKQDAGLKELDFSNQSNNGTDIASHKPLTREDLLRRKQDLQYTYYKNLLAQQERKLSSQKRESEAMAAKMNEYSQELLQVEDQLRNTDQRIQVLNFRKRAVNELIKKHLAELVKKRNLLHAASQLDKSKS